MCVCTCVYVCVRDTSSTCCTRARTYARTRARVRVYVRVVNLSPHARAPTLIGTFNVDDHFHFGNGRQHKRYYNIIIIILERVLADSIV